MPKKTPKRGRTRIYAAEKMITLSIRAPRSLKDRLIALAREERRDTSNFIRITLEKAATEIELKIQETLRRKPHGQANDKGR